MTKFDFRKLERLKRRLSSIGTETKFCMNYPWVYIVSINGKPITQTYYSDHAFTVCFATESRWLNLKKLFKLIRQKRGASGKSGTSL